jgi:hypothetical protein
MQRWDERECATAEVRPIHLCLKEIMPSPMRARQRDRNLGRLAQRSLFFVATAWGHVAMLHVTVEQLPS